MKTLDVKIFGLLALFACKISPQESAATLVPLDDSEYAKKPKTISIEISNYCPSNPTRSYQDLFVSNLTTSVMNADLALDTDSDGVPDAQEQKSNARLAIEPQLADSNGDGYSDLTILLAGIGRFEQGLLRCNDHSSNDGLAILYKNPAAAVGALPALLGLANCEKEFLHLEPANPDTDHDGVPDYLELRAGLNPLDASDALADTDNDGLSNLAEVKRHTPVTVANAEHNLGVFEYQYNIEVDNNVTPACTRFGIKNIPIINEGKGNVIGLYLLETDNNTGSIVHTAFIATPDQAADKVFKLDFVGSFTQP